MDPFLESDGLGVRVARGGERRIPIIVHNPGASEDHYRFEILGDAARWGRIEPRYVPGVAGGGRMQVELVLRPPTDAPPGTTRFAVRCVSLQDAGRCAVVEGDAVVGASRDVDVVTAAVSARGRRSGQYLVQVTNAGTAPTPVRLAASDPRHELGFALANDRFTLDGGGTESAYLSVRPRRPKLVGADVSHPFVLEHHGSSGAVDRMPHRFQQRALLGPLAATVAGLLVAGVAAFGGVLAWPSVRGALHGTTAAARTSAAAPSARSGPPDQTLHGSYVVWQTTLLGDLGSQGAPQRMLARLKAVGVPARIVDSTRSPQLSGSAVPALLVVQDGFRDLAAAQAACAAHRDVAPACSAVAG
jgi:hypothetical protein